MPLEWSTRSPELINNPSLSIWSVETTSRGKVKRVQEYLDWSTGEVIPVAGTDRSNSNRPATERRRKVLKSLRPELRSFAVFVLKFRNKRRGLTPGVDTLCKWYSQVHSKQPQHVRRYLQRLKDVGILAGENVLGKDWQMWDSQARNTDHLGEDVTAWVTFWSGYIRPKLAREALDNPMPPHWLRNAEPTGNLITYEAYRDIIRRITGRETTRTAHEHALGAGRMIAAMSDLEEWYDWRAYQAFVCPTESDDALTS